MAIKTVHSTLLPLRTKLKQLFSLQEDTDEEGSVESIKKNAEFRSGNAWTLIFAIFIASVGLNVNSAAVIIGAMLISPLMGTIMGAGLALGTYDFDLLKLSGRNLFIAVVLSILTSFCYFYLSPLGDAQSELLARTRPTAFDVLIAIFGGATGIIAASRKEKGNAIPGVAIATALMPPLCTAGYGLASGEFRYFFGAIYLFCINSVFICLSTFIFVRILKFKRVNFIDPKRHSRIKILMVSVAILTFLPSAFLAWYYAKEASFQSKVNIFLKEDFRFRGTYIAAHTSSFSLKKSWIKVSLIGSELPKLELEKLTLRLADYGLSGTNLEVDQSSLAHDIENNLREKINTEFSIKDKAVKTANREIELLRSFVNRYEQQTLLTEQIRKEIAITFPEVDSLELTYIEHNQSARSRSVESDPKHVALIRWKHRPPKRKVTDLENFLKIRSDDPKLNIYDIR